MPIKGIEAEWPRHQSTKAAWSLRLGWLAIVTVLISGFAFRFRVVSFEEFIVGVGAGSALALAGLIIATTVMREFWARGGEGARTALSGVAICLIAMAPVVVTSIATLLLPKVNDVTTDSTDPPALTQVAAARAAAGAPPHRPRASGETGLPAYPNLRPLVTQRAPEAVFDAARALVDESGWLVVSTAPPLTGPGLIVATAETMLLGFKDDIAIRVAAIPGGTKVDVRSASRVGRHDLGVNARRIRSFVTELERRVNELPE
jgi:Protein of unknown function (DUF1499)